MALKNLKLLRTNLLFLLLCPWLVYAQAERVNIDSIFTRIFDNNIRVVENARIIKANKPVILISPTHCSGCVKYFAQSQKNYQFIFVINNKSLLEINRLLSFYKLKPKHVYFVVAEDIKLKKKIILGGPTPLAFSKLGNALYFVDYTILNAITKEFSAPHKQFAKEFRDQVSSKLEEN